MSYFAELSLFPLLFIKSFSESSFSYILSHLILTAILIKVYLLHFTDEILRLRKVKHFPRFYIYYIASEGFPGSTVVEKPPANAGATGGSRFSPWFGRSLEKMAARSVFLLGKFHRSLTGCSPCTTEHTHRDTPHTQDTMHTHTHLPVSGWDQRSSSGKFPLPVCLHS